MTIHHERRKMPYSTRQMFDLVNDVKNYPVFLPWISAVRIRSDTTQGKNRTQDTDLIVSFKVFQERFRSQVFSNEQIWRIDVTYIDGPFRQLNNYWIFHPLDTGCDVEFFIEFEFRSKLLQATIGLVFNEAMQRVVASFETRAKTLYCPRLA